MAEHAARAECTMGADAVRRRRGGIRTKWIKWRRTTSVGTKRSAANSQHLSVVWPSPTAGSPRAASDYYPLHTHWEPGGNAVQKADSQYVTIRGSAGELEEALESPPLRRHP